MTDRVGGGCQCERVRFEVVISDDDAYRTCATARMCQRAPACVDQAADSRRLSRSGRPESVLDEVPVIPVPILEDRNNAGVFSLGLLEERHLVGCGKADHDPLVRRRGAPRTGLSDSPRRHPVGSQWKPHPFCGHLRRLQHGAFAPGRARGRSANSAGRRRSSGR